MSDAADLYASDPDHPPLVDVDRVAAKLRLEAPDELLRDVVRRVSARFRGEVRHPVTHHTSESVVIKHRGGDILQLPAIPVTSDVRLSLRSRNGAMQTVVAELSGGGLDMDPDAGLVERVGGWPTNLGAIRATYTHGYTTVPEDIQDVVQEAAEATYTLEAGVTQLSSGNESASFSMVGVTERWTTVVDRYRINWGDSA